MNNNVLISTAMLNALWENRKKDTLDLLIPFLKSSIINTVKIGEKIDINKISEHFTKEYGYDTFPTGVIVSMLNRLSPEYLKKIRNEYYLIADLDDECKKFDNKISKYKEQSEAVITALKNYLSGALFSLNLDEEHIFNALMDFFVVNGLCLVKEQRMLEALKLKDSKINYAIAQFIISEAKKNSIIYDYITQMVGGFFVSTALSMQPTNGNIIKSKYKDLICYLDTRIILCALGLHLPEETSAAQELIKMLQSENAVLKCFEHTYDEIYDILNAYKFNLQNPNKNRNSNTLESWDEYKYTVPDVDAYLSILRRKIESLGIAIERVPSYNDNYVIDESALYDQLDEHMQYKNKEGINKDVSSVAAIYRLRKGNYCTEIERCKYIFITNNLKLAHLSNQFLDKEIGNNVPAVITDVNISSITWLKSYSTNKDFPRKKLLSNALATAEPSSALISSFIDKIEKINNEGGITDEEAAIIRSDLFCRREANRIVAGDPNAVSEKTVFDIRNRLRDDYLGEESGKAKLNYDKYKNALEMKNKPIRNALSAIERTRDLAQKFCRIVLYSVLGILAVMLLCVIIHNLISSFSSKTEISIFVLCAAALEAWGTIDLLLSKKSSIKKIVNKVSFTVSAYFGDRQKRKYEKIFPDFNISKPE